MNHGGNGASSVNTAVETIRPPSSLEEKLLRTWPEMDN